MSWSAFVLPLHACPPDVLDWVRESASAEVPEDLPGPQSLPTVEQVLTGFRDAGCYGDAWYRIAGSDDVTLPSRLASPSPFLDLYLGEVSITIDGTTDRSAPVHLDDRVAGLSFRKPREGLLRAVSVMVALGGQQLVFDTLGEGVVVGPDASHEALSAIWPW